MRETDERPLERVRREGGGALLRASNGELVKKLGVSRQVFPSYVGGGCDAWKGVEIIDRDAKTRFVVGRTEDYLGVWSAAKGELLYSMHLPAKRK